MSTVPANGPSVSLDIETAAAKIASQGWGNAGALTFSFASAAEMPGATGASQAQIKAIEAAFALWSDVANIPLTRLGTGYSGPAAYSSDADIVIRPTPNNSGVAWAVEPGAANGSSLEGDIYVNFSSGFFASPFYGSNGFMTLMHEIGHALGLEHPGEYNGGSPSYHSDAAYREDSRQYTIMSYFAAANTGASHGGLYARTPLLHDIAALQIMYGANMTTRSDDTIYGFNSTAGRPAFSLKDANDIAVFAIWDSGGTDTLDFSGYSQAQLINLNSGSFSNIGGLAKNVAIASGATIENAIGGSGSDTIIGNLANNRLEGGGGSNSLHGGAGDDLFIYSGGRDFYYGGAGIDTADFSTAAKGLNIAFSSQSHDVWTGAGTWFDSKKKGVAPGNIDIAELRSIEAIVTTKFGDVVVGNSQSNTFFYVGGSDRIDGRGGTDEINFSKASGRIFVTSYDHSLKVTVGSTKTTAKNVEHIVGSKFDDSICGTKKSNRLDGGYGNDKIFGGDGRDHLFGGSGNDILMGGKGSDTLTGNDGDDIFVFDAKSDHDVVADFETGVDRLQISATVASHFDDLDITDYDAGCVVQAGSVTVRLEGVTAAGLSASDFVFA